MGDLNSNDTESHCHFIEYYHILGEGGGSFAENFAQNVMLLL